MARTRREIMDQVYAEAESINTAVTASRNRIAKLCDGQTRKFTELANEEFRLSIKLPPSTRQRKAEEKESPSLRADVLRVAQG